MYLSIAGFDGCSLSAPNPQAKLGSRGQFDPWYCSPPQPADGGFVACSGSEILYVGVDGEVETHLSGATVPMFGVAPDGTRVAVALESDVRVLGIPSAEEILRVNSDVWLAPWGTNGWSADGTALLTVRNIDGHEYTPGFILRLDGEALPLPPGAEADGANLSPDARYLARGRPDDAGEYGRYSWRYLDIIDAASGRVLRSLETGAVVQRGRWEWAAPGSFAWSVGPNAFHFGLRRPAPYASAVAPDIGSRCARCRAPRRVRRRTAPTGSRTRRANTRR